MKNVVVKRTSKGYDVTKEITENDVVEHFTQFYSKSMMRGYISEGASIILHRLLVARGVPENFCVVVFNQYWEFSCATYVFRYFE